MLATAGPIGAVERPKIPTHRQIRATAEQIFRALNQKWPVRLVPVALSHCRFSDLSTLCIRRTSMEFSCGTYPSRHPHHGASSCDLSCRAEGKSNRESNVVETRCANQPGTTHTTSGRGFPLPQVETHRTWRERRNCRCSKSAQSRNTAAPSAIAWTPELQMCLCATKARHSREYTAT